MRDVPTIAGASRRGGPPRWPDPRPDRRPEIRSGPATASAPGRASPRGPTAPGRPPQALRRSGPATGRGPPPPLPAPARHLGEGAALSHREIGHGRRVRLRALALLALPGPVGPCPDRPPLPGKGRARLSVDRPVAGRGRRLAARVRPVGRRGGRRIG